MTQLQKTAIRKADSSDAAWIAKLVESYAFKEDGSGSLIPLDEASLSPLIAGGRFFVADGIGCASVVEYGIAELRSLAVSPGYQSRDIGSALVEACKEEARQRGHKELYALVQHGSYGFFEKQGFVYTETPPQKLQKDCERCPLYKSACNEFAVVFRFS